jgi:hypothetical protein
MNISAARLANRRPQFPPGGGFFGANPPGVKLIATNYVQTVAGGATTAFFTIATPLISTLPTGKGWRVKTSALATPGAVADTFVVQLNLFGAVFGNQNFPKYTVAAWTNANYGGGIFDMEILITNPNTGSWQGIITQRHNARGNAPADTDMSLQTTQFSQVFAAGNLIIQAFSNAGNASVTHIQTTLEQVQ